MRRVLTKKFKVFKFGYALFVVALVSCGLFFASCAMIFPLGNQGISTKEYNVLAASNPSAATCYQKGFRGFMLALDIILFWPSTIIDAIGGYFSYYYYEPVSCVVNQNSFNSPAPVTQPPSQKVAANEYSEVDEAFVEKASKKKTRDSRESKKNLRKISKPIFVAVLESASGGILEYQETQFITNVLREEAVRALSSEANANIMTRENIVAMLPPEKSLEECEGSCLIETGKNISADYVSQARIGKFGKNLTISVELYKTANNKLISSFNAKAPDIDYLEEVIREKASQMFYEIISQESDE